MTCTRLDCNGDYWTDQHDRRVACSDKVMEMARRISERDRDLLNRLAKAD